MLLVVAAVVVAAAAALLAPRLTGLAGRSSRWTSPIAVGTLGATAGVVAAVVADGVIELVTFALLALGCACLVATDIAAHRLPDAVTVPTAGVLLLGLLARSVQTVEWHDLGRAVLAGLALGAAFLLLALISPASLGLGDVKLAALLGLFLGWFGWSAVLLGVVVTFVLGGLVALGLVLTRRASGSSQLAFGPWLVAGAGIAATVSSLAPTP